MDIEKIKSIDIVSFLAKHGLHPKKSTGKTAQYLSPFGKETQASFMVNKAKNRFHDYHSQVGGDIVDLVCALNNCSFKEAVSILSDDNMSDIETYTPPKKEVSGVKIHAAEPLTEGELMDYIVGVRKINIDVATEYCNIVSFSFPYSEKDSAKVYTAVGFQTGKNSYELRNSFMKVCAGSKMIRTVRGTDEKKDECLLFEAWIDYLSYLTHHNILKPKLKTHILNGVGLIKTLKPMLEDKTVYVYVDSDRAGDSLMKELDNCNPIDRRSDFMFFSDYNDYLMNSL